MRYVASVWISFCIYVFQMRPITMKASREFPEVTVPKDYLYYKANDVVHVIDKK